MKARFTLAFSVIAMVLCLPAAAQTGTLFVKSDNVGIGEADPQFKLHITRSDGGGSGFRVSTTNAVANFDWFFQQNAVTGAFLVTPFQGGNAPLQVFPGAAGTIVNTLVLRNGRVGVGTQNPAATLDVNGAIYQRGGPIHPDYVFEPQYDLESIEQHAAYMWQNKHLPAVGKGKVDDEGRPFIEVGARSQAMLEELEKAHIYIDQLNQQVQQLQETVARQQELLERLVSQ